VRTCKGKLHDLVIKQDTVDGKLDALIDLQIKHPCLIVAIEKA
jgi:hypothetical protein